MIYKLERWAWWGGAALAMIAGIVNAVGLRSYAHQAVTHVTGTTSLFALALAHGDGAASLNLGLVLASFFVGALVSGFIVQSDALKLGRRYGVALLVESILLFTASVLMGSDVPVGSYFASAACGLQNAMASTYSGAVLRTTHLSGMFTDCGAAFGHLLRGAPVAWIRIRLYALLIGAFTVGGIAGSLLFDVYGPATLFIPAGLTGVVAVSYMVYAHARRLQEGETLGSAGVTRPGRH
ncbi:MAG TPA: YoaK family protein [Opitutaceae bacterium]|nr:YoaK family protein [Opitutaceae bacterium]